MYPAISVWNFTPTSIAFGSIADAVAGVAVLSQMLHGQFAPANAAVVNDHVPLFASALPATSFTRGSVAPPTTVAVYGAPLANKFVGSNVAVRVATS